MTAVNRNDLEIVRHIRASFDEELDDGERIALERLALVAQKSGAADEATLEKANRIAQRFGLRAFGPPSPRPPTPAAQQDAPAESITPPSNTGAPAALASPSKSSQPTGTPHAKRGFELVVYSKSGCPYCDKAKAHLAQEGIPFTESRLDDEAARLTFYEASSERWGRAVSSMPQIVIEVGGLETLIGGYRELLQSGLERTVWEL